MKPVAPRVAYQGEPIPEEMVGGGSNYAICVAVVPTADGHRTMLTRWRLSADERARIAAGEDVYVGVLGVMVPLNVSVGPTDGWSLHSQERT